MAKSSPFSGRSRSAPNLADLVARTRSVVLDHPGHSSQKSHGRRGGAGTGQAALDAVPAKLTPGAEGHFGHYEGEQLDGPPGMGSVRALSEYEGVEHLHTNNYLRHGPALRDDTPADIRELVAQKDADTAARVREIDQTMAVSRLQDDVVVERGVVEGKSVFGRAWHEGVIDWDADFATVDRQAERWEAGDRPNLTGKRFTDRGYVSTTADPEVAVGFVERRLAFYRETGRVDLAGEPVVMRISVPKGTGAVQLSPMQQRDDRGRLLSAAEILLERNLTFEVTADHGVDDGGIRRLDIAVVSDD